MAGSAFAQLPPAAEPRPPTDRIQPQPQLEAPGDLAAPPAPERIVPAGAEEAIVLIADIVIEGATVYPDDALRPLYQHLLGERVPLARLFEAAQAVEERYRADGYVLTRVIVPAQAPVGGVFRLAVIEGYIAEVVLQGDVGQVRQLADDYLQNITRFRPVRIQDMERYLLLTNDIPGVAARGLLRRAEGQAGAAQLVVTLERDGLDGFARIDNRGSEFTGPWEAALRGNSNSWTRFGEHVGVTLFAAPLDASETVYGAVDLDGRVGDEGLSFRLFGSYTPSQPGADLEPLEVESTALRFSAGARYPIIRTRRTSLFAEAGFDYADIDVDLLGEPFQRDRLRIASATIEGSHQDAWNGISQLRLQARQGLGILGATDDGDALPSRPDADGSFTSLRFEAVRLQRLTPIINVMVAAAGQYAFDPVLADEEFQLGGLPRGRGYEPAEITGDHGIGGTVELQVRPEFGRDWVDSYQLYAFWDIGAVWQIDAPGEGVESLASAGLGLRAAVNQWLSFEVEAAQPLTRKPANDNGSTQFYFSVSAAF